MSSHIDKREAALKWWRRMPLEAKFYRVIPWLKSQGRDATDRHPDSLTGREVQEIWEKEPFNKEQ